MNRFNVFFAGGGTGGHLFPGIAVAEELQVQEPQTEILFGGSNREIEQNIISQAGFKHVTFPIEPSTKLRKNPVQFCWRLMKSYQSAHQELKRSAPQVVVGLGGFASVPIVYAAHRLGIPVVLLEQNKVVGRATSLLSRWANLLCFTSPETEGKYSPNAKMVVTGNPVRRSIRNSYTGPPNPASKKQLLILGGSQGSLNLNRMVIEAFSHLQSELADWKIVHQTGQFGYAKAEQAYASLKLNVEVAPFFDNMEQLYADSSFAICRAGATTLAELACVGCPAILVPYPHALADHQKKNATYFVEHQAAWLHEESPTSVQPTLTNQIEQLLKENNQLPTMRNNMQNLAQPDAAKQVARQILSWHV